MPLIDTFFKICIITTALINPPIALGAAAAAPEPEGPAVEYFPPLPDREKGTQEFDRFWFNHLRDEILNGTGNHMISTLILQGECKFARNLLEDEAVCNAFTNNPVPLNITSPLYLFIVQHDLCRKSPHYAALTHLLIKNSSQDARSFAFKYALSKGQTEPLALLPLIKQFMDQPEHVRWLEEAYWPYEDPLHEHEFF